MPDQIASFLSVLSIAFVISFLPALVNRGSILFGLRSCLAISNTPDIIANRIAIFPMIFICPTYILNRSIGIYEALYLFVGLCLWFPEYLFNPSWYFLTTVDLFVGY